MATNSNPLIVFATLGSRGDVQPLCVLASGLKARGFEVRFLTSGEYKGLIETFGFNPTIVGSSFENLVRSHQVERFFEKSGVGFLRKTSLVRRFAKDILFNASQIMIDVYKNIKTADLIVYSSTTFFVGEFAARFGIRSVRVLLQPLFPTRAYPLSLVSAGNYGPLGNRLSYESLRLIPFLLRKAFAILHEEVGAFKALNSFCNPLTVAFHRSEQLLAFSRHLSPPAPDWPKRFTQTGFWFRPSHPSASLPDHIEHFLTSGPPPIYVGLGSMLWQQERNSTLISDALALSGSRAIVSTGAGGIRLTGKASSNILVTGSICHETLFPRVSAAVHHGGAGTTAAALRHGLPSVILPVFGDQMYWGSRVAALGAGEAPLPLSKMSPAQLSHRISRVQRDRDMRCAAVDLGRALSTEVGVDGAVALIESWVRSKQMDCASGHPRRYPFSGSGGS